MSRTKNNHKNNHKNIICDNVNNSINGNKFPRLRYCNNFSFAKVPFFTQFYKMNKQRKIKCSKKLTLRQKISNNTTKNKITDSANKYDIGIVGIPFDSGCSFRPGARFGPSSVRSISCLIRKEYNMAQNCYPYQKKICDFGDIFSTPFDIKQAVDHIHHSLKNVLNYTDKYIIIGGDHTISYPSLKAIHEKYGSVSIIHFDSHLDTYDDHFGCKVTHGTPFNLSVEEGFLNLNRFHVGIRGGTYSKDDLVRDKNLGFEIFPVDYADKNKITVVEMIQKIKSKLVDTKVYISIDIDVIDPAFAPATGTPEVGGFTSREFLSMIRELKGLDIIGADIVEIAPAYDSQANITSLLGASICCELLAIM